MDVTYGLLSNLVKTRSILRVLAPIASQISLLIILNESEDYDTHQPGDIVPCSQAVMQATNKLCMVAKQQAQSSTDKEFIAQTMSSCEVLELSSSNLYIAAERMEISNKTKEVKAKLIQASKDVLQGTMKVLLVADDAEIRRLITTKHIVTEKLSLLQDVRTMSDLVTNFKEFTDALAVLTGMADKRQRDLIHARQRERIISALAILKQCVSSLSTAMQNAVKYSSNAQAQMGKSFVVNEILEAVRDIVEAIQNTNTDEDTADQDGPGNFVTTIDQALEALSQQNRDDLHLDLEMWTEEVVRHSMTVAHVCYDNHRDLIIKTCQRVIQVKSRVIQMHRSAAQNQGAALSQFREDYDDVCELLVDEFCELEKSVNIALLHLVIEYFKETTEPLERLVKKAVYINRGRAMEHTDESISEFEDHAEKACQIATLAAASSTDARRVHVIRSSVQRLENLDPEITAAVITLSRAQQDRGAVNHLKLLMKEWTLELTSLLQVLDEMTDPKMFMLVSERKVEDDINTCNGCMLISEYESFVQVLQSLIGRSRRVAQVTERIVDNSDDAVFRNGLLVFLQQLRKAITAVRSAGSNVREDFSNTTHQNTLRRRFTLLQEALRKVKMGLSERHHPDILSPLRMGLRGMSIIRSSTEPKLTTSTPKVRPGVSSSGRMDPLKGEHVISKSVPKLHLGVDDTIQPQQAKRQHTELRKSASTPGVVPVDPQTYAWKLMRDLLSWATKGEKDRVNALCGDLLGWTNHIVDVASTVLSHCEDKDKKKEMDSLCFEVDGMVPNLLEKIKYVLHGDFSDLNIVKQTAEQWAVKVEKVRVFVDITVEKWKTVCDKVCAAARCQKMDLVKHEIETVETHQKAITDLITITEALRWEKKVKGQHKIEKLLEVRDDLENVTVTFKTTAEMITDKGLKEDLVQLEQLSREWSGQIFSAFVTMETLSEEMIGLDEQLGLWPCITDSDSIVENLTEETAKLKDLIKCACFGDEDKKELYKGLIMDMRECVEEMKTTSIKKRIASRGTGIVTTHYSSLCLALQKGVWVLKALQCIDLSRQQSCSYSRYIDMLIDGAFQVKVFIGQERQEQRRAFGVELDQFTTCVKSVRKKVLSCIQLSAELDKRSVVRQSLDAVNAMAPEVVLVLTRLADTSDSNNHGDVSWCRLQWSAKVCHLVVALKQISDINILTVESIQKMLIPEAECPLYEDVSEKLQSAKEPSQNEHAITDSKITSPNHVPLSTTSKSPGSSKLTTEMTKASPQHQQSKHSNPSMGPFRSGQIFQGKIMAVPEDEDKMVSFEPVTVNLKAIEEQIVNNARRYGEKKSSPETGSSGPVSTMAGNNSSPSKNTLPASPSAAKSISTLLKDAQYIQSQTCQWEDDNNPIVKVAKTMSTQILHMSQYIQYQGPITSHLGLVQTAKAVAENSGKILKFANTLCKLCIDEMFCQNLQAYCCQIPTIRKQLIILANVQLGTAQSDTADRMLVQNAQNLMKKILATMSACEAVCIKGIRPDVPKEDESAALLATRWRQKYLEHIHLGLNDDNLDELGLRIIEEEVPPPALSQIFKA